MMNLAVGKTDWYDVVLSLNSSHICLLFDQHTNVIRVSGDTAIVVRRLVL